VEAADLVVMGANFAIDSGHKGIDLALLQHLWVECFLAK